jgi:hypothetical protein
MKSRLPAPTAKDINEAHRLARSSAETAVQHAIRCGQMLMKLKDSLPHGEFQPWIERHCDFSDRQARRYMQAAEKTDTRVRFDSLRQLLGVEPKPQKKHEKPDTSARSVKGAVMNPPESAAQGSEAGNRNKPVGVGAGQVRPPVPAPVANPDAPEFPDDVDEDAALAAAEADYMRRVNAIMEADDKLAEAQAQLKQQAALIGTLEVTRDGYMRGKEAVTKMLQTEQRKVARLEKELAKLREENEALRERVAIMEAAA